MEYEHGMQVCDSNGMLGMLFERTDGFTVAWSDNHIDTMKPGWMSVDYGKVWPVRPLTKREVAIIEALGTVGAASSTHIDALTGRSASSSALSRLRKSGHVERSVSGDWSLVPHEGERWVRQVVQHGPVAATGATPAEVQPALALDEPVRDLASPLVAVLGAVTEALGGDVPLVQLADRVREVVAARDAATRRAAQAEEYLEAACLAARLESGLWHKLAGEVEALNGYGWSVTIDLTEARRCAAVRAALLDRVAAVMGGSWEEAVERVESGAPTAHSERDAEAARLVERALLDEVAKLAADLARERAEAKAHTARALVMGRKGEE